MKWNQLSMLAFAPAIVLTGCGDAQLGKNVSLKLDAENQSANLEVEMMSGLEVSLAGEFPLADEWGHLYFVPATRESNSKIGIRVNVAKLVDDKINIVTTLPNGAPMPAALQPPLFVREVMKNGEFDAEALLSVVPELQIGMNVGIKAFSSKYVIPGVAICQNFRNSEQQAYAAVCLYGPNPLDGRHGGIFVGGTFGEVIKSEMLSSSVESRRAMRTLAFTAEPAFAVSSDILINESKDESSEDFELAMHDPKDELKGKKGLKTLRNVQKILKVRR